MRLYISILAVAALTTTACGKKATPVKPEPAKTGEPVKADPGAEAPKKEEPVAEAPKKEEPVAEAPKKEEPVVAAVVDRNEAIQKGIAAWAAGNYDESFASFTDDAVRYDVGSPMHPETKGKAAIIELSKKLAEGTSDVKAKAARIIEAGDVSIVETVMTGNITTKGADGAEVVKAFALPAAMVFAFNAEGKVTTMWTFMDEANLLQQIGAMPGLPEGFVAAKLPETTEIIKGEANPAHAALYKAFGEKMKPDTIDAAIAEHFADDFSMTDCMSGKVYTKATSGEMLKAMMGMFTDDTHTQDKQFSVGEYYVSLSTSTSTYKQGIPGATPDTKVTMQMLDVSRIVDGKFKSWAGYSNGLQVLSQLGLMGGAAEKPADAVAADPAAAGSLGVAECDLYLTKMKECLAKLPDAAKSAVEQGMKTNFDSWKQSIDAGGDAAKATLGTACKSILDTAKQATGQLCPDVKWE